MEATAQGVAISKPQAAPPQSEPTKEAVLVGFDMGTNTSVFLAWHMGQMLKHPVNIVPTILGVPKEGLLPGIIPAGKDKLFGYEALNMKLHCTLVRPVKEGFVDDLESTREFMAYMRDLIDPGRHHPIWAVVGSPASASPERLRDIRRSCVGAFHRILLVPEPFLAAMGLRDETQLSRSDYFDPVRNSLFIDVGAGTTDLCVVQGSYPTANDQISFPIAGDNVDEKLMALIQRRYPDVQISPTAITRFKEQMSYVGGVRQPCDAKVSTLGKMVTIDISDMVREACATLIPPIVQNVQKLAARCNSDAVEEMMANIILTGGGSQIRNFGPTIEKELAALGFASARCHVVQDYKELVAKGGLKTARAVKEHQWSILM